MKDSHEQKTPISINERDIEIDRYTSSVTHTLHTLHTREKREPRSLRIRPSAYDFASNYARLSNMTMGEVTEQAWIFYIDYYPVDGSVFIVENTEKRQNLDEKIQDMICIDKLEKFLNKLKMINGNIRINHKEEFLGILRECKKVNIRSDKLSSLISEAMAYFE